MLRKYKSLIFKFIIAISIAIVCILTYIYFIPVREVINLLLISFIIAYTLKPLNDLTCIWFQRRYTINDKR